MNEKQINWILKISCMVVIVVITIVLDKFIFLTAKEILWLVCGFLCWSVWDNEVE